MSISAQWKIEKCGWETKNKQRYFMATYVDLKDKDQKSRRKMIEDEEFIDLVEEANKTGQVIDVELEKNDDSGYWDPTEMDLTDEQAPSKTTAKREAKEQPPSGQETGMWWKEAGESLRAKMVPDNFVEPLTRMYFAKMLSVLGITQSTEQAKRKPIEQDDGDDVFDPNDIPF